MHHLCQYQDHHIHLVGTELFLWHYCMGQYINHVTEHAALCYGASVVFLGDSPQYGLASVLVSQCQSVILSSVISYASYKLIYTSVF